MEGFVAGVDPAKLKKDVAGWMLLRPQERQIGSVYEAT